MHGTQVLEEETSANAWNSVFYLWNGYDLPLKRLIMISLFSFDIQHNMSHVGAT